MIGGYETKQAGICQFEGVKTRRFLNAPVSLDFKHRIGRRQDMPIKARYSVECNTTVVNGLLQHDLLMNVELNHLADLAAKEAQPLINAACMKEYDNNRLHYFACNHERFMLDSVNQNT
jgi:hypothetical protein